MLMIEGVSLPNSEPLEILYEYDSIPFIYICCNHQERDMYLGYRLQEDPLSNVEQYLYVAFNTTLLDELKNNKLSIYDAIMKVGYVFVYDVQNDVILNIRIVLTEHIPEQLIPKPGVFLHPIL